MRHTAGERSIGCGWATLAGALAMSLKNVLATLTVMPDSLSAEQRRRALLAINRLTVLPTLKTADLDVVLPALDCLHASSDTRPKQALEERRALAAALTLPLPPPALLAAVRDGAATLAHAAEACELQRWAAKRLGDHRSAIEAYARICEGGRPLATIAASEAAIRKRLAAKPFTSFGVQKRTFSNLRGRLLGAVRLVDLHGRYRLSASSIPRVWRELVDSLPGGWRRKLWPLITYAVLQGRRRER